MRKLLASLCVVLAPLGIAGPAAATPSAVTLDVQTYNLNLGADLTPLFGATDLASLQAAATHVYGEAVASLPEERMRAIAQIIAGQRPDVVGLQEVALWSLAPYKLVGGFPIATGPYVASYDFLALLLGDLAALGEHYRAVAVNTNFDSGTAIPIAVPISDTTAARYTDRNVIIVRDGSHLDATNPQQANYQATFTVTLLGQTIPVHRGWTSIDLTARGRTFRFVDTHLEAYGLPPLKDQIRNPQAVELAGLVAASPYPTTVVGDINATPTMCPGQGDNNVAYGTLVGAALTEVWPLLHPADPCSPASWTSGQDSVSGPVSTLTHRIDDVFLGAGFAALQTSVVGDTAAELSQPHGFWPSDHASTVAKVRLNAAP
ncbi:MAG TPA: endonuclease/exonuclease/phosphatase family protein [Jatrophihabitans sp.]|jgi:endonuclease/exonuclease/phosphatase family metal-dependent hydrolase|nr:endonuclease/exonuclease/phosphatase family protein [Jatrophihabitans sp.]